MEDLHFSYWITDSLMRSAHFADVEVSKDEKSKDETTSIKLNNPAGSVGLFRTAKDVATKFATSGTFRTLL